MKSWRLWVSAAAILGALGVLMGLALYRSHEPGEAGKPVSVPAAPTEAASTKAPDPPPESAAGVPEAAPRAEPATPPPASGLPVQEEDRAEFPAEKRSAEAVMREVERRFRLQPRAVRMDVTTTRVQSEPIAGLPPFEELRLWGMFNGDPQSTAALYVFYAPRRFRGTGLLIEDAPGSRDGDAMWYRMRTFRRFQHIPQTSLRLLVAGTCMTYEDARGFLATDRYEFRFAESAGPRGAHAPDVILARPLTPELENDTGYKTLEIRVDTAKHLVTEIRFTSLNGRLLKVYTAGEAVQVGDAWLPGVARIEDLQSSVVSEMKYRYWPLDASPPAALYDTEVEDPPLLDRLTDALARLEIEAESPEPGEPGGSR